MHGYFSEFRQLARVGMSAVQIDESGNIQRAWSARLTTRGVQNPPAGEQAAAAHAVQLARKPRLAVDCAAVVSSLTNVRHSRHPKNPASGWWRFTPRASWPAVSMTKAHRSEEDAFAEGDWFYWSGNDRADDMA